MDRRRADTIAETLEERILEGAYASETRLDEVRLAEEFDVSRTPVREAFASLAQSGLVEQVPRRGVFVRQPGPRELMEMFEMAAELEAVAARLAAARMSETGLNALRAANADCAAALPDADAYYRANESFHRLIFEGSGNRFVEEDCRRLQRRLRPFRRLQLRLRGRLPQSLDEHSACISAIEAGNGALAADIMRRHVAIQGEKFHLLMAQYEAEAS
ncbi:MAG: GntR family transcriptional regulator [Pseudomonadota bacterium]